jgi:hypothetical protein
MRPIGALLALLLPLAAKAELAAWPARQPFPAGAVLLDTRPAAVCAARSVRGARCLPVEEFRDAQGRLPDWREILWLFSTARLTGSETALVLGEQALERDAVAALLHIAGQREVRVVEEPVSRLLDAGMAAGPGAPRDFARQVAYTGRMRDTMLVLRQEFDPQRQRVVDAARPPVARSAGDGRVSVLASASVSASLAALTRWWLAGRHDVRVLPEPVAAAWMPPAMQPGGRGA